LVRALLVAVMAVAASLTVLTHSAQIGGIPFSIYALIGTCAAIIVATFVLWGEISKPVLLAAIKQRTAVLLLLACGLMGTCLSLVSYRPSQDDAHYVPNTVYYIEHPNEPMGFKIHFVDSGGEPFVSYHFGSLPFEYAQGIVAYFGNINFLTVYYFLAPALFGFMIPLVWFYAISRFSFPSRAAITGAFIICLSLLLMGEQHRSFGNFAFNRIFQGKTVLLAVGLPMFAALTIDFFHAPCARRWLYLFVTSVAMVGFSTCAAILIPMLALLLAGACCFSFVPNMRSRLLHAFCYFCTLAYPVLYAVSFLVFSAQQLGGESIVHNEWLSMTPSNARSVFGGPVVVLFLVIGTALTIVFLQGRGRRFLVIWIVLLFVSFLNPFLKTFITKYITTPSLYWRVFYLLPFPLVVGLSAAALALRLENKSPKWRLVILAMVTVLLLVPHLWPSSFSVFRYNPRSNGPSRHIRLAMPKYKVANLVRARRVLAAAPPAGTMLAVPAVSRTLPMLTARYPQISVRPLSINMWMAERGTLQKAIHRTRAQSFLAGRTGRENFDSLVWVIQQHPQIRSIVAKRRVAEVNDSYLFSFLHNLGFTKHRTVRNLVVFIRPRPKS